MEELRDALQKAYEQIVELQSDLKAQVCQGKARIKEIWQNSCEEQLKHDEEMAAKDNKIAALRKAHNTIVLQHIVIPSRYVVRLPHCQLLVRNQGSVLEEAHLLIILQENHLRSC